MISADPVAPEGPPQPLKWLEKFEMLFETIPSPKNDDSATFQMSFNTGMGPLICGPGKSNLRDLSRASGCTVRVHYQHKSDGKWDESSDGHVTIMGRAADRQKCIEGLDSIIRNLDLFQGLYREDSTIFD